MKAGPSNILPFFRKSHQFKVPIYQRTYSWNESECMQLLSDIVRVGRDEKISAHFIGSIVYIEESLYSVTNPGPLLVIDGQQRLATLTLLLVALAKTLGESEPIDGFSAPKLMNYYILNKEESDERRYKLLLTQTDKESLISIIDQKNQPKDHSIKINKSYKLFMKELAKQVDLSAVCKGLSKLMLVDIAIDPDNDNPQLIFESMNSTGIKLSQADLIRNYILMGIQPKLQEQLYEEFWRPMEISFGQEAYNKHFGNFIRYYLTVKTGEIPKEDDVYEVFKNYSQSIVILDAGIKELVRDIHEFAKYYRAMEFQAEIDEELKISFYNLRDLKVNVAYPFLLKLYQDYTKGLLLKSEFIEVVKLTEAYVFRRAICAIPANSLNKIFANFIKIINKDQYLESIKVHFLWLKSYRRFPLDQEFIECMQTHDLYNFRHRIYWLRRFENYGRRKKVSIEEYTIEHIMPQSVENSKEWKMNLGENWQNVSQSYLHTLGNLTLTAYNSQNSNKSFQEKRDIHGGFRESPLNINKGLGVIDVWNEDAIKARSLKLAKRAIEVWPAPYIPEHVLARYQQNQIKKLIEGGYTRTDHPQLQNVQLKELFDAFAHEVKELDFCVNEEFLKHYVTYKAETNFVSVESRAKYLLLLLNIEYSEINDPRGICRDVSHIGTVATGNVEVKLSTLDDLPYVIGLVRQSLDLQL